MTAPARTRAVPLPAEAPAPKKSLIDQILEKHDAQEAIVPLLPRGVTMNRLSAICQLEMRRNPELAKCTHGSIVDSIAKILRWGLEIGDTAHLVPRKDRKANVIRCTAIADYKGLAQLMTVSGAVRAVEPRCVYEGEVFQITEGSSPQLTHEPFLSKAQRGPLRGAYVRLVRPFGVVTFEWMAIGDIDTIRNKYSQQYTEEKVGPCPDWYAKKTVIRRASKLIPKDPKYAEAFRAIEEEQEEEFGPEARLDAEDSLAEATVTDDGDSEAEATTDTVQATKCAECRRLVTAPEHHDHECSKFADGDHEELALDDQRPRRRSAIED